MDNAPDAPIPPQPALLARYPMPGYLMVVYALLFIALGWFSHQRWGSPTTSTPTTLAATLPAVEGQAPTTSAATSHQGEVHADTPAPPEKKTTLPLPAISNGEIPPLTYSAHVYTSDETKRSITLNGLQFREGDSPVEGLTIEQIQQDMTIFSVEGEVFILEALEDWPGGKFNENERSADNERGSAAS
ncbi:general secretion pathway protein [Pectobacterium parmentieri]|uniref:General secretion pathway protein n=1 Tax=Pectobacterium parmentieri TaxID=1905730 RepID=A0A0H3I019_PECPM|nr:type II secretion system assembly factor GspB [Pectobacterium parmentieri]ACX87208.1 general secretion pathway protein [Pectobacterium parmentieri WPP163]AFI89392.1 General secretion pathway protein B [Pectobacterium parmentieri]AOR59589.1 general secretion pathway protein [Pectobacterium parmentieri]AYH05130.1 general secretion pathway protein [Pectobacterium parmentieri]AYH09443.1 general secretion pathway protein [Pectobacterium parmentieri]